MELFKLYLKEKVRCVIIVDVSLEANLEGQGCGGKQRFLPFVGSNMGFVIFLKKRVHQKTMC